MDALGQKTKLGLLIILILLQAAIAAWFVHNKPQEVDMGYLVKGDNEFIVAWKGYEDNYRYLSFASLDGALQFAKKDLGLKTSRNPVRDLDMEYVWMEDRFGAYTLLWKTSQLNFVNQITFHSEKVADFFAQAFRDGAYAPSPFGHSILLLPDIR